MSYRNPKFFYEDFSGFNTGMQSAFKDSFDSVYSYFQNKIDVRKENIEDANENQIKNQEAADGLETTDIELDKVFSGVINDVTTSNLEFTTTGKKEGQIFNDGLGFFGDQSKQNFQTEQEQQMTSTSLIENINGIKPAVAAAASDVVFHEDYDMSTPSAILAGSIVNGFKTGVNRDPNDPNFVMNFDRKTNKINSSLTISNPYYFGADTTGNSGLRDVNEGVEEFIMVDGKKQKNPVWTDVKNSYKPSDIQRIMAENDPSLRVASDKVISDNITNVENQIKTSLNEWKGSTEGKKYYSIQGGFKKGTDYIDGKIDELWANYSLEGDEVQMGENNFVVDIITNKLNYNEKVMFEHLDKHDSNGFLNNLTKVDGNVNPQRAEVMSMILETNPQDKKMMGNLLFSLGVERGSDEMTQALNDIKETQNSLAKKYFKDEILKGELKTEYVKAKKPDKPTTPPTGPKGFDPNDPYVVQKMGETAGVTLGGVNALSMFGQGIPSIGVKLENGQRVFTQPYAGEKNYSLEQEEFVDTFLNAEFTFAGGKRNASGFEMSREGNVVLTFDGSTVQEDIIGTQEMYDAGEIKKSQINKKIGKQPVKQQDSTLEYNIYNPESMRKFADATSTEAGGSGDYSRKLYSVGYDTQMLSQFTSPSGLESMMSDPKMTKWIDFIDKKGGNSQLVNHIAANYTVGQPPAGAPFINQLPPHVQAFYERNKDKIETQQLIIAARNN